MVVEQAASLAAAPERLLVLEGACNFRDLGGYDCAGGGRVRFGRLFRSGALSYLGTAAAPQLGALGVRTIWDLRHARERQHAPTCWPDPAVECRYLDDPVDQSSAAWTFWPQSQRPSAAELRGAMLALYGAMPRWLGSRLRGLFEALAAGELPLVFHCSAGKDRTGVASALVLSALGVPRETIYEDYLLTNTAADLEGQLFRQRGNALGLGGSWDALAELAPEARQALLAADADYLGAALRTMELDHGSVERYLEAALGIGPEERRRLRTLLVEG